MLIGILSDSHDKIDAMTAAMATLRHAGAQFYIHCGDVGGEGMLDQLAGLPAAFVWGNNDWERASLADYAKALGIACHGDLADLTLDGKRIAVIHGDRSGQRQQLLQSQDFDYLLQGHTHRREDIRVGRTRVINPGAIYRAKPLSVAVLDTETDGLRSLVLRNV